MTLEELNESVATRLLINRLALRMSEGKAAKLADISKSTLKRAENGNRTFVPKTVNKLAKAYKTKMGMFIRYSEADFKFHIESINKIHTDLEKSNSKS